MSVRHGLLALLSSGPSHGYQLKQHLEERLSARSPVNIGQVYTTLSRLERDGLVARLDDDPAGERTPYELTGTGREELERWVMAPLEHSATRDELVAKVLAALATPGIDVHSLVQRHRRGLVEELQRYTRVKKDVDRGELSWLLTVDALVLRVEAMIRWLDQCEGRLARAGQVREETR